MCSGRIGIEWQDERLRGLTDAVVTEGSTHGFSITASAAALPLTVTCQSSDMALQLSCSGEDMSGGEWLDDNSHQAPITCALSSSSRYAWVRVLRTYNNSAPADRAAVVTCTADVDGKAKTLNAILAVTIRHEVLPIFGRVRVRLVMSPSNSSTAPSNTTAATTKWFEHFSWRNDLDQSVEVVTSTAAYLELTPPMRHVPTDFVAEPNQHSLVGSNVLPNKWLEMAKEIAATESRASALVACFLRSRVSGFAL